MKKIYSLLVLVLSTSYCVPDTFAYYKGPIYVMASFYKGGYLTASGEVFRPEGLTCAHKYLPFNTKLLIRYNNRSVVCRINDLGPFVKGRGLGLSLGAARQLGILASEL